MPDIRYRCD